MGHGLNSLNTIGGSGVDLGQLFLRVIEVVASTRCAFLVVDSSASSIVVFDNKIGRIWVLVDHDANGQLFEVENHLCYRPNGLPGCTDGGTMMVGRD
jgi:hypothetical protein